MAYVIALAMSLTIYAILAIAYDLIYGHAGLFSAASIAFYASGAYLAAIVFDRVTHQFLVGCVAGIVGSYCIGWLIGRISLHLMGDYLVIATLGIHFLIVAVITNWSSVTGGTEGTSNIPRPEFGTITLNSNAQMLALSGGLLLIAGVVAWKLVGAPYGRLLHAVRDDSSAVASLGRDPARVKRGVFAFSSALCGLAGVIYATYITYIDPSSFLIDPLILIVAMVIIGGAGTIVGPLIGSLIVFLTPELLRHLKLSDATTSSFIQNALFGALLVLLVIFRPQGLLPEPLVERLRGLRGDARGDASSRASAVGADDDAAVALTELPTSIASRFRERGVGPIVEIRNLSKSFGGNRVVDDVSLTLQPGRVTSIIGPNGAGKTTLLSCIGGSVRPDRGTIKVGDFDTAGLPAHKVVARGVARSFQDARLFGRMTVQENVELGFQRQHGLNVMSVLSQGRAIRTESAVIEQMATELLEWVSLTHVRDREARQLSGGQRMLTALLRTIATSSSVILLDEPTAGVAPNVIPKITQFIRTLSELGHTVCLIEHRMELVEDLSDWVVVMNEGKVALEGTAAEAMASEELQRIYFGDDLSTQSVTTAGIL